MVRLSCISRDMQNGMTELPQQPDHEPESHTPEIPSAAVTRWNHSAQGNPLLSGRISGRVLGKYRTGQRLGSGAMSTVYSATDVTTDRSVALKILPPNADPVMRSRFRQEARTALQLDHPNIVHTLDVGELTSEGVAYIAMELVEGESLADLLERYRQLSVTDTCRILAPIARALEYAHINGIIHRDVKPSNILLRSVPQPTPGSAKLSVFDNEIVPLLSDFGIARALDAPELTSAGRTVGTPAYMAPEQCSGEHEIDGRADIYALGTVFYRCLVGRPPYTGTTTQILYAHVYSPLLVPDEIIVNLPMPIVDMMRRMLMKEPEKRYSTAGAVAADLEQMTQPSRAVSISTTVDGNDATMTMTSLPSTERKQTSSTMLVPAPAPAGAHGTPISVPRVPTQLRQSSRGRQPNRIWWAVGLVMIGLLTVGFVAVLGSRATRNEPMAASNPTPNSQSDGKAASPDAEIVDADASRDADPAPPNGERALGREGTDTTAGGTTTAQVENTSDDDAPVEVPVPTFDVPSVWNDAEFFYAERDWLQTLESMTLLLRSNREFNERTFYNDGTLGEIYVDTLQNQPDHPFWLAWQGLFGQEDIDRILFDSFVGLAALETSRNRPLAAAEYWKDALRIRPGAEELISLADASAKLADALPADRARGA